MPEVKSYKITEAGRAKLQAELDDRIANTRNEIAREIDFARSYGDLSENAEYTEAKRKQSENEERIAFLQDILAMAVVVDESEINTDQVSIGNVVRVFNHAKNQEFTYHIVGVQEADPFKGSISDESPVGRALIGAVVGMDVDAYLPNGSVVPSVTVRELSAKSVPKKLFIIWNAFAVAATVVPGYTFMNAWILAE